MEKPTILVIDDEEIVRVSCIRILRPEGYNVKVVKSGIEGLKVIEKENFDLVLTDLKMPDMDGIEVLKKVKEGWPGTEIVVITGYGTVSSAVQAMKFGAFDYLEKPFTPDQLLLVVSRALEKKRLIIDNIQSAQESISLYRLENIVGTSKEMQKVFQMIATVAPAVTTVLLTGESGTGKELVARAIHYNSPRKEQPFVVVDCGTIPDNLIESELFGYMKGAFTGAVASKKGLLELSDGGTIFFDEIGNLDLSTQAKLLRVIQEKEFRPIGGRESIKVDVRVITATNKNLEYMIKEGSFREDLFYRLNIFPILLPPLREKKEDIPLLSDHFLKRYSEYLGKEVNHISADAMKILISHDWPGNVRELENTIHRATLLCMGKTIRPEYLTLLESKSQNEIPKTSEELKERKKDIRSKSIEEIEKAFIFEALKKNNWNITKASTSVGMQRSNFHALMKKYDITKELE
ncbi:MAG: sigma-54-dependent Fis family transcriptional regulator [Nitrospirae bacterium]|nr:sigma-54-dependent Fis family transcriptional regulator [Nitrospirota bacterium]